MQRADHDRTASLRACEHQRAEVLGSGSRSLSGRIARRSDRPQGFGLAPQRALSKRPCSPSTCRCLKAAGGHPTAHHRHLFWSVTSSSKARAWPTLSWAQSTAAGCRDGAGARLVSVTRCRFVRPGVEQAGDRAIGMAFWPRPQFFDWERICPPQHQAVGGKSHRN